MELQDLKNATSKTGSNGNSNNSNENNQKQKPKPRLKNHSALVKKAQESKMIASQKSAYKRGLEQAQAISEAETQGMLDGLAMNSILQAQNIEVELDDMYAIDVPKFNSRLDVESLLVEADYEEINPRDYINFSLKAAD